MLIKFIALFINEIQKEIENFRLADDLVPAAKEVLLKDGDGHKHGDVIAVDRSDISEPVAFGFGPEPE